MGEQEFIANPHALIVDGICTEVVYMQNYDSEEIARTLKKYTYDKVVQWEDYGGEIYIGYVEYFESSEIYYATPQPYPSWTWKKSFRNWVTPVKHPWDKVGYETNIEYEWDEELLNWVSI